MSSLAIKRIPRATYRLQLTPDFGFAKAEEQLDHFAALGISDLYLSPIFAAVPGSTHGYDVTDYNTVNEELGGRKGFDRLCVAAEHRGLGLVLDFVPNHMGTSGQSNHWWQDLLRFGPRSRYARFFDIQWSRHTEGNHPRILLPVLETHAGKVLAAGKLHVEEKEGRLRIAYGDTRWPVNIAGYVFLLTLARSGSAEKLGREFSEIASQPVTADINGTFAASVTALEDRLVERMASDQNFATEWRKVIGNVNRAPSVELDALLQLQHYRLTRWKTGIHEINYRRFFAISTLVGLRMEDPDVFAAVHATLGELLRNPAITGLRIDHVDGLREPAKYLERLQALAQRTRGSPIYVAVEKILNGDESLPAAWPVDGATGYEFIPQAAGLLVHAASEPDFQESYTQTTGERTGFGEVTVAKKIQIMRELFPDVVGMLGWQLADLVAEDPLWCDFSRHELTTALGRLTAHLAVYRTYRTPGETAISPTDAAAITAATQSAIAADPRDDPVPVEFIGHLLRGSYPPSGMPAGYADRVLNWVLTWQQYTGAIMAKSVEDTAYYTYVRFVGLNEVGGDPGQFGGTAADFHAKNRRRHQHQPQAMLTTSTHDTKLSEDVRARLYGLSEFPMEWSAWIAAWETAVRPQVTVLPTGEAPDALDRYRLYQVLLGVWPLSASEVDEIFRKRLREHLRKAVSEAKRWTSDVRPNDAYFAACDRFINGVTNPESGWNFLTTFLPAAEEIAVAGARIALTQLILKATVPGLPDLYQGCEAWDFSLVDPDNRRPVDYVKLNALAQHAGEQTWEQLFATWRTGAIKLRLTQCLFNFRRDCPQLFERGNYIPLEGDGPFPIVAYVRRLQTQSLVIVLPLRHRMTPDAAAALQKSSLRLPPQNDWQDLLTGKSFARDAVTPLAELFSVLPFAILKSAP